MPAHASIKPFTVTKSDIQKKHGFLASTATKGDGKWRREPL
jgi:hypothetical protein